MHPSYFVLLERLPLTPNGKLDRKALPAPDGEAYATRSYEAPQGEVEETLARIWSEVLGLERVGRHDNFFDLGGHSLLAVRVLERMRREGLRGDVRALFGAPTLSALAATVSWEADTVAVPANGIEAGCERITPQMLPLVELSQDEIDRVVATVAGGVGNVQDIYPLAPLQEGILFHHLLAKEGDPYLLWSLMSFSDRSRLDAYVAALEAVIARHDILRTAVVWEGLREPVQVVWRRAPLVVEEVWVEPSAGDVAEHLRQRFDPRSYRLDVRRAPLMQLMIAHDPSNDRWVAISLIHHLSVDHTAITITHEEIQAHLRGDEAALPAPLPFRNFVAQSRLGVSAAEHEAFFGRMLGDVEEPTAPFRLLDVLGDGSEVLEAQVSLEEALSQRLRRRARALKVSAASLFHVAWAQVLARTSGREDPVFGTVLFGRMQGGEGADRALGLFINILPVRLRLGLVGAQACVEAAHRTLTELLRHEHASLVLAQRCSSVPAPAPLFTAFLNYRHSAGPDASFAGGGLDGWDGIEVLATEDRTNYPLTLSVDDFGEGFWLTAQASGGVEPERVCAMMVRALEGLVEALEAEPEREMRRVDVLPAAERHQLLVEWNATEADYPKQACVHELFEAQAARSPESTAVVYEDQSLSYGELNTQANRLAHHLRGLGVRPDSRVAICVERSPEMVVGLMAILKAGGAYVPLDPAYPAERLGYMLQDSAPVLVLTHAAARGALSQAMAGLAEAPPVVDLDGTAWSQACPDNLDPAAIGLNSAHLAYVIYTSGSTGTPKGVMVGHSACVNRIYAQTDLMSISADDIYSQKTTIGFVDSFFESVMPISWGARLVVISNANDTDQLVAKLREFRVSNIVTVPSLAAAMNLAENPLPDLRHWVLGGEGLTYKLAVVLRRRTSCLTITNIYGSTEAAADSTFYQGVGHLVRNTNEPIGRPISNTRIYLLDGHGEPVPRGVAGEIHIGGAGVARGYLNRAELTAERFIASPFVPGDRLYKTGDLGRYLPDGNIEFLGRNDFQVKVRGFRIELGEIEARLLEHEGVHEAAVLAREDASGDKRLAAYYVAEEGGDEVGAEALRSHLAVRLPDYMVPAAYVRLSRLPLTPNGKLDRKALPAPDGEAYATRSYEAPQGEVEETLARIWSEVLGLERVGRHDNFFDLGGHSLLAVRVLERMRREGLRGDVRALFGAPTLSALAATVSWEADTVAVPANGIEAGCERITPQMLPLVELSQDEIDRVVATVAGGVGNVQDIYPLAPLQEGILFHHLLAKEGDPYLLWSLMSFSDRSRLDAYVAALEAVIARHDILRTAVVWEGLREPVQVVWRRAPLVVEEVWVEPSAGDVAEHLRQRFDPRSYRLDVRRAPLMQLIAKYDEKKRSWLAVCLQHHFIGDGVSSGFLKAEVKHVLQGRSLMPPAPLPFRNFVARSRLGVSAAEHEAFFGRMLGDVEEPTAPFGLLDVLGDGSEVLEAQVSLEEALSQRLRRRARALKVSAASLFHVAWAQVLARTSGREDPVFGTVLFGRMQGGEGADRALGLFINTLPVRLRLGVVGAQACVEAAHRTLTELLRHEHASLVLAQRCSSVPAPAPLFTALLNYRHSAGPDASFAGGGLDGWDGIEVLATEERTNYPLTLSVDDFGEGFWLTAQASGGVEPERVCAMMVRALEGLVEALEAEPEREMRRVDVLPAAERHQLLVEWNATEADYPKQACVHELFEAQAARSPESTAVVYEDQSLSYGELNTQANRLAHHLRGLGVRPDSRVAICVERSPEMVVGLMAILKAGGAYVPLDPAYPAERLGYMLQDSAPVLVLTHAAARGALSQAMAGLAEAPPVVDLDGTAWSQACPDNLDPAAIGLNSAHLAYVIYTSGSTGTPKGVCLHHLPLVNLLHWQAESDLPGEADRTSQMSSISFDMSFHDVFSTLAVGGAILLPNGREFVRPDVFFENASRCKMTRYFLPTSTFNEVTSPRATAAIERYRAAAEDGFSAMVAGERLRISENIRRLFVNETRARLQNNYGPSETHVCTSYVLPKDVSEWPEFPPIGRPISNTRIYLLDGHGEPVPRGVAGEIHIGGAGVARGYLNRAELTAERFIASPFVPGDRLYKTGDLGRYLPDGNIEFLGRNDFQVKVRGFRIELGEIEARLLEHEGVHEAAVLAREDASGDKRLAAYYVAEEGGDEVGAEALRSHLAVRLPDYMVPAAYVRLSRLPLTPNGKLDRKALPAPDGEAYATRSYEAPQGEVEETLARIWSEVLGLERVGRHDNFFDLGGHSLLAVRVLLKVRKHYNSDHKISTLLQCTSLCEYATLVTRKLTSDASRPIKARSVQNRAVASFAQQRLWFLAQMNGASEAYHIPLALHLRGRLDKAALVQALDRLVARHEGLRTTFVTIEGEVFQQIQPAEVGFELKTIPVVRSDDLKQEVTRRIAAEASCAFDLEAGPLIRGQLLQLGVDENILLITMHHIVSDGWSLAILTRDLDRLYHAASNNEPCSLEPLPIQYADYAEWQRQWSSAEVLSQQIGYWRRQLVDVPVLMDLPLDRKRPEQQDFIGGFVQIDLDSGLTSNLKGLSQGCGATLFMTLLAGWATVLARLCGQQDVVIGTPVANRAQPEVEELIGLFVNTLALRVSLEGSPSVKDLIERVKTVAIGAQDNQDLPFEQIVDLIKPARSLSYSPLFQVMFAWQEQAVTPIEFLGTEYKTLATPMRHAKFDLTLDLTDLGERLVGGIEYSSALFDHETVERFAGYLKRILAEMAADPNGVALKLPMLGSAERHQLLVEWNATEADYPKQACVHELFEAQAARSPESTAVVYEDQSLSYGELNTQANRLAHHLRGLGVRPDSRVAICVERSPEMVVGLMAILKAGGAYVPLDPAYPAERLGYMLQDSAPVLVLTHAAARGALSQAMAGLAEAPPVVDLDGTAWSQACPDNLDPAAIGLNSAHLAYVIYTSGSTGTPKGVMVEHRGVVALCAFYKSVLSSKQNARYLQVASISFDVFLGDVAKSVLTGRTLIIAPQCALRRAEDLRLIISSRQVSTAEFPPDLLRVLISSEGIDLECIRNLSEIICGGESWLMGDHIRLRAIVQGSTRTLNTYGLTECTIDSAYIDLGVDHFKQMRTVPIGRPISNTRIYLLDGHGEPVPRGVAGEIHIGGAGVARGYLNRAELTAERFIASPFVPGDRLYKTGDLGRYLPDGNIEFLGRNDFQVKVRGFRIELGEIEARLLEHEGVHEAAVLAREDASGDKRLAAYYVAEEGGDEVGAEALRSHLAVRLPDYMVPAAYVRLSRLPLTPNGKLDRKALPAPDGEAYATRSYEAPQGEVEETLARIWSEVLGLERVGRHDNFFDLGGHSLLAVRVLERMRREGLRGEFRFFFNGYDLAALASRIKRSAGESAESWPLPAFRISKYNSRLVLMKSGSSTPIIFIHALGGGLSIYHSLVDTMPASQLVYGIHAFAPLYNLGGLRSSPSLEKVAGAYARMIQQIPNAAECCLAGWSFGGVLAHAVANELTNTETNVTKVVMVDSHLPTVRDDGPRDPKSIWSGFLAMITEAHDNDRKPDELHEDVIPYESFSEARTYLELASGGRVKTGEDDLRKLYDIYTAHVGALDVFEPGSISVDIVHYVAGRATSITKHETDWSHTTSGTYKSVPIDATHNDILGAIAALGSTRYMTS